MAQQGNWSGAVLVLIGILLLALNLDLLEFDHLADYWPLILIAVGARMLLRRRGGDSGITSDPPPPPP